MGVSANMSLKEKRSEVEAHRSESERLRMALSALQEELQRGEADVARLTRKAEEEERRSKCALSAVLWVSCFADGGCLVWVGCLGWVGLPWLGWLCGGGRVDPSFPFRPLSPLKISHLSPAGAPLRRM